MLKQKLSFLSQTQELRVLRCGLLFVLFEIMCQMAVKVFKQGFLPSAAVVNSPLSLELHVCVSMLFKVLELFPTQCVAYPRWKIWKKVHLQKENLLRDDRKAQWVEREGGGVISLWQSISGCIPYVFTISMFQLTSCSVRQKNWDVVIINLLTEGENAVIYNQPNGEADNENFYEICRLQLFPVVFASCNTCSWQEMKHSNTSL